MPTITVFNRQKPHIHIPIFLTIKTGEQFKLRGILDTGAPATELSDQFLHHSGIMESQKKEITLKPGLETQKYGKMTLPLVEICSHSIQNMTIFISHFDNSWGVDVLIGLDFFKRFKVTIDYSKGEIQTDPF